MDMEMAALAMGSDSGSADYDAVSRAKTGDEEAFEELYRENVGRVYAVCLRMVRDTHRAEELTQESFVRAWQRLSGFREESAFSTWMHRLAVNVVLSDLRKRNRRNGREAAAGPSASEVPVTYERAGERMDLESAIAKLPEGARAVFVLHDVEGYRHREIAETLGIAPGTAKAQLHRARRMLREILS